MRKLLVAVAFAAACAASIVYGPVFYATYLALNPPALFADVNGGAKGDRLPLKTLVARDQELSDGTPVEEAAFPDHNEEPDTSSANTTVVAKK